MALAKQPLTGKRNRSCICQDAEMYPKKTLEALQGSSQCKGHDEDSVVLGNVQQNRKVTFSQTMAPLKALPIQSIPTEQLLLYHTLQRRNRKQFRRNQQEHEAVSPDSYIPEVKTNSLYLAYPQSRLSGHLSTAQTWVL